MSVTTTQQNKGGIPKTNGTHSQESMLEVLASQVQENAKVVNEFLRTSGHAAPSFASDAPATSLPASAPPEIGAARQALMGAALQIFHLAAGPSEYLPHLAVGVSKVITHIYQYPQLKGRFSVYSINTLPASDGSPISTSSSWSHAIHPSRILLLQPQLEFQSNSSRQWLAWP